MSKSMLRGKCDRRGCWGELGVRGTVGEGGKEEGGGIGCVCWGGWGGGGEDREGVREVG